MKTEQEYVRNVGKWGNSGGILLPKEWVGNQVKIILINRTDEIKKEVISIIYEYLDDVLGVYLTGSYSRGEQDKDSDIDIIAITNNTKKEIISGKYHISLITLENLRKTLEKNPILIAPRLKEAKAIINPLLLDELNKKEIKKISFKNYIEETKRIILINEGLINLEKNEYLTSPEIIYSLILRLRGIFLIKCILHNKTYLKKDFLKYLEESKIEKNRIEAIYKIYRDIRNNEKTKDKNIIKIEDVGLILDFLKKESNLLLK
jgi:predicted nucleotidyltransferase